MPQKLTRVSLSAEAQAGADAVIGWYISEGAFIAAEDFTEEIDSALNSIYSTGSLHWAKAVPTTPGRCLSMVFPIP